MIVCPCCGRDMQVGQADIGRLSRLDVQGHGRIILDKLIAAFPKAVGALELQAAIYDAQGRDRPMHSDGSLRLQIHKLRAALLQHGWDIPRQGGGFYKRGQYRLKMQVAK